MFEIIDLFAECVLERRRISATDCTKVTSTESITLNISKKFLEMLKSSFKVLNFPLDMEGKFSKKESKIFKELEIKMHKMLTTIKESKKEVTDIEFDNNIALALAVYNFGEVYMKIIEVECDLETLREKEICKLYAIAENYFKSCLHLTKIQDIDPSNKTILIAMRAVDKILYIRMKQQKFDECYEHLLDAFNLYVNYTQNYKYPNPIDVAIILGIDNTEDKELDTRISLDNLHIENLKRLSIVYSNNPDDKHAFVAYMHIVLNILIKEVLLHKSYKEWAMAATELSRFFIRNKRFTEARNYLAAASYMMEKYDTEHLTIMMKKATISDNQNPTKELDILYDEYQYGCAKIAKLWGQYGLQLLDASIKNLLQNIGNQSCEADNLECGHSNSTKSNEKSQKLLIFTNLENELKDTITKISDKYLLNFHDIKIVFEKVLEWFNTAMKYFTVERDIETYGEIILHMSLAHKWFANFEQYKEEENTLKIYEQQIALLDNAIKKVSHSTAINDIKQLMFIELGVSYATVLSIKSNIIKRVEKLNQKILLEMKNYTGYGMDCFISCLKHLP